MDNAVFATKLARATASKRENNAEQFNNVSPGNPTTSCRGCAGCSLLNPS
uniref:Uncharacterized protein n=1 Tax=Rheinheimera sp. BAL341 TaxID=1708203 RepID=A0A486XRG9_9GAMM